MINICQPSYLFSLKKQLFRIKFNAFIKEKNVFAQKKGGFFKFFLPMKKQLFCALL